MVSGWPSGSRGGGAGGEAFRGAGGGDGGRGSGEEGDGGSGSPPAAILVIKSPAVSAPESPRRGGVSVGGASESGRVVESDVSEGSGVGPPSAASTARMPSLTPLAARWCPWRALRRSSAYAYGGREAQRGGLGDLQPTSHVFEREDAHRPGPLPGAPAARRVPAAAPWPPSASACGPRSGSPRRRRPRPGSSIAGPRPARAGDTEERVRAMKFLRRALSTDRWAYDRALPAA